MKALKVRIAGTGSHVPARVMRNDELQKMVDTSDEWITQRTGIKERRIAADNEAPSDLGANAARKALESARVRPEDVDLIVCGTSNPDHLLPSTACIIQRKIGAARAGALDVLAACSGFAYAFGTGASFVASGAYKNVLVLGAETLSRITNWTDRTTCVLFGDGAGAALLQPSTDSSEILYLELGADGTRGDHIIVHSGGAVEPETPQTIAAHRRTIHMKGREVYEFAVRKLIELVERSLEKNHLKPSDLGLVVPHQMNIRIIKSVADRLHLPMEKFYVNVHKYGNTSSASIPVALDEAVREGRIKRGDLVAMFALGGGLTWGTVLLRY